MSIVGIFILAAMVIAGLIGGRIFMPEQGEKGASQHLRVFLCWLLAAAGIIGLVAMAVMGPGMPIFGADLSHADLIAFLALVTGVPVALAGSTYAILLAYKSIRLTESEQSREQREKEDANNRDFDQEIGRASADFVELSNLLEDLNVVSFSVLSTALGEMAALMHGDDAGASGFAGATSKLHAAAGPYSIAFNRLCRHVGEMLNRPSSLKLMEFLLSHRQLAATKLVAQQEAGALSFVDPDSIQLFAYGLEQHEGSRAYAFLATLQTLNVQAARLKGKDLIEMALRTALDDTSRRLGHDDVVDIPAEEKRREVFFSSYIRTPTRLLDTDYQLHWPARMLLDCKIKVSRALGSGLSRQLAVADILLVDMVAVLPSKADIAAFLETDVGRNVLNRSTADQNGWIEARLSLLALPDGVAASRAAQKWAAAMTAGLDQPEFYLLKHDADAGLREVVLDLTLGDPAYHSWRRMVRSHLVGQLLEPYLFATVGSDLKKARKVVRSVEQLALREGEIDETSLRWFLLASRLSVSGDGELIRGALRVAGQLADTGVVSRDDLSAIEFESKTGYLPRTVLPELFLSEAPSDMTGVLSRWIEGQFRATTAAAVTDPVSQELLFLRPDEVGNSDGMMPVILAGMGALESGPFMLVADDKGLCGARVAPIMDGRSLIDLREFVLDFDKFMRELPRRQDAAHDVYLDLSEAYAGFTNWAARDPAFA